MITPGFKIVGFDFDGTLVDDSQKQKENIKNLFLKVKEKGLLIAIVTGKGLYFILDFLKNNDLSVDYIVSFDGGSIYDFRAKKEIYLNLICNNSIKNIIAYLESIGVKNIFLNKSDGYKYVFNNLSDKSILYPYTKFYNGNTDNVIQLYLRNLSYEQKDLIKKNHINLSTYFFAFNGFNERYSCLASNYDVDKYITFNNLLKILDININKVAYFGDSINDIKFFNNRQIFSVAVFDSIKTIKDKAQYKMSKGEKIINLF